MPVAFFFLVAGYGDGKMKVGRDNGHVLMRKTKTPQQVRRFDWLVKDVEA
ncbi:hypothetical protein [Dickeya dianthicola]|nr:hypothetical protein [Dickeya dianthicola]MCI4235656.1 hypothetical protein [Dickeya dianthicola]MCI4255758.1 hypothetical protein [Dickeya dianthicola]